MIQRKKSGPPSAKDARSGHLVIIGGGEDRSGSKKVLKRFVELAGGKRARIAVLTASTTQPKEMWKIYDRAFDELGVQKRFAMDIRTRVEANSDGAVESLERADAVFITGGAQRRLLSVLGGTRLDYALHTAFRKRGICIGGTSAGASAMSEHMLGEGKVDDSRPQKGMVSLAAGFGFLPRVIIDQHFSERHRLVRLLSVVAQNPYLLGVGIDEDTALVVRHGVGIEIVGEGGVTLVDGSEMTSNMLEIGEDDHLELINVRMHVLPAGGRYFHDDSSRGRRRAVPAPLLQVIKILGAVS